MMKLHFFQFRSALGALGLAVVVLIALARAACGQTIDLTPYLSEYTPNGSVKQFTGFDGTSNTNFVRTVTQTNSAGLLLWQVVDTYAITDVEVSYFGIQGGYLMAYGTSDSADTYFSQAGGASLPLQMVIGQTYVLPTAVYDGTDATGAYTLTETNSVRAIGFESVTVPAGTFTNALRIEVTSVDWYDYGVPPIYGPVNHTETNWLVAGIGEVKFGFQDTYPDQPSDTWVERLTQYLVVTNQPHSVITGPGLSATLAVSVATNLAVAHQWMKNGAALPNSTNATLTINSMQPGDVATYAVQTTSPLGSTTTTNATLSTFAISSGATPSIVINAPTGTVFGFDYLAACAATNAWTAWLTNFTVNTSPTNVLDAEAASVPRRYYRAWQR